MNTGYNVMHPYSWLQTAGDPTGDANFQVVNGHEGNFFNLTSPGATPTGPGFSGPPAPGVWSPISGMTTTGGADATDAAYFNAALAAPGSQLPLGGPTLVNGNPNDGPVHYSDYATGTLPSQYLSPMPPWKNAPMQISHANLPPAAAAAAAAAATSASSGMNTHAIARASGGCAGCSGGCGGGKKCQGRNAPLGLDATNDFLPLYAHPTANAAQSVGAYLYQTTSTKTPAWGTSQGTPADHEIPLQGM